MKADTTQLEKPSIKLPLFLMIWPFIGLIVALIFYAIINLVTGGTGSIEPVDGLFGDTAPWQTVLNIILFIIGAGSVGLGIPSFIIGLILLITRLSRRSPSAPGIPSKPSVSQSSTKAASVTPSVSSVQPGAGKSIAGFILGTSSIVMASAGIGGVLGILGIIFSAIGLRRKAHTGLAIAGLITGIVGTIIGLIIAVFLTIALVLIIQTSATDEKVRTEAVNLQTLADRYDTDKSVYPTYSQLLNYANSVNQPLDLTLIGNEGSGLDVEYVRCDDDGARIWYWSLETEDYLILDAGDTTGCDVSPTEPQLLEQLPPN